MRKRHEMQISFDYWLGIVSVMIPVSNAASIVVPAQFTRVWELGSAFLECEGQ